MKKMIITAALLGVAAVGASAEETAQSLLEGAVYKNTANTQGTISLETALSGGFTLTATLDVDALATCIGKDATWKAGNVVDASRGFLTFTSNDAVSVDVVTYKWGDGSSPTEMGFAGYNDSNKSSNFNQSVSSPSLMGLNSLDLTAVESAAITFAYDADDTATLTLTLVSEGGAVTSYYGTTNASAATDRRLTPDGTFGSLKSIEFGNDYFTSVYLMSGVSSTIAAQSLNTAAISAAVPEPTTATLSLLALAGLAARRRRK